MTDESFNYTPIPLCQTLINMIEYDISDSWYEPFMGSGNFYDNIPSSNKDWSEISKGRDFFTNNNIYDIIITNPPFRINGVNSLIPCITKMLKQSRKSVNILINLKCFNSLTPLRLKDFSNMGWYIHRIHICNVKKWFGRYYFIQFRKQQNTFITFDTFSY
jgi:hypothetical protein